MHVDAERRDAAGREVDAGDHENDDPTVQSGRDVPSGPALTGALAGALTGGLAENEQAPPAPEVAARVFTTRLDLAQRYAAHLADTGISHGLIGPREVPRLWERHILNCAVIAEVMPEGSQVVDVGSGAGLPGLCIAIARPDLQVTLVEPMERRTAWLEAVTGDLGLNNVTVRRARAEELHGELEADVVTARAVAALDKLARWCLPLVRPGGRLVAMKGSSAESEIAQAQNVLRRLGALASTVHTCGVDLLETPTTVVVVEKGAASSSRRSGRPSRDRRSAKRR